MTTPVPEPMVLRPREAARTLSISTRTLFAWTKQGRVPHIRVGTGRRTTVLYPVAELRSWLAAQTQRPAAQEESAR
jgi:excisionase family DNA binding protein